MTGKLSEVDGEWDGRRDDWAAKISQMQMARTGSYFRLVLCVIAHARAL